ncbi:MAG TPA: permease, partial [Candidatus Fermentibacter sp.]|nr:permease [Candidatus Fermentibacter sp.]
MRGDLKKLAVLAALVLSVWIAPLDSHAFYAALGSSFSLLQEYARLHIVTSLLPALLLAGAIATLLRGSAILKRLMSPGPAAYMTASVSGAILAVCSCTVLPMFAGIYSAGAGIGPASTFLFAGPAINILAFVMSTRVLGPGLGFARAICAIILSVLIGLVMSFVFGRTIRPGAPGAAGTGAGGGLPTRRAVPVMAAVAGVMIFARSGCPCEESLAFVTPFASWGIVMVCAAAEAAMLVAWFGVGWWRPVLAAIPSVTLALVIPGDPRPAFLAGVVGFSVILACGGGLLREWFDETLGLTLKVVPLLLGGVAVTGFL